ncbi:hypothetical protein Bca4012_071445 [Brassica carinata]
MNQNSDRFNQDGGLQTPRRRGVSEEAEQKLRGDYMSSYFVKLRPLDFNPNQSCNFLSNSALYHNSCLSTILRETWITLIRAVVLLAARSCLKASHGYYVSPDAESRDLPSI